VFSLFQVDSLDQNQNHPHTAHKTRPLFTSISRLLHLNVHTCLNAPTAAYACILSLYPPFHAPLLYSPSPESVSRFAGPDKLSATSGDITSAPEVCKIHSLPDRAPSISVVGGAGRITSYTLCSSLTVLQPQAVCLASSQVEVSIRLARIGAIPVALCFEALLAVTLSTQFTANHTHHSRWLVYLSCPCTSTPYSPYFFLNDCAPQLDPAC
jgi:hypothetical protein